MTLKNNMPIEQLEQFKRDTELMIESKIRDHEHDGNLSTQIRYTDIFGQSPSNLNTESKTIATTGNTDWYIIAPIAGDLVEIDFSGTDALAANDTNYITFSVTNLGRDGSGSAALLLSDDANTTKATGGSAISANTVRELTLNNTNNATKVVRGDRLRIRAAVTNTLANTVTNSIFTLRFN